MPLLSYLVYSTRLHTHPHEFCAKTLLYTTLPRNKRSFFYVVNAWLNMILTLRDGVVPPIYVFSVVYTEVCILICFFGRVEGCSMFNTSVPPHSRNAHSMRTVCALYGPQRVKKKWGFYWWAMACGHVAGVHIILQYGRPDKQQAHTPNAHKKLTTCNRADILKTPLETDIS